MGETYLSVTSPDIYSKRFSDYVKQFHADDVEDVKKTDKRHRAKHQEVTTKPGVRQLNPRRQSESSTLPPINSKTPTFSQGVWSFRNPSPSQNHQSVSRANAKNIHGKIPQKLHLPKATDESVPRKKTQKSPESVRLSPLMPSVNQRLKSEKKAQGKLTINNKIVDNSPRRVAKTQHNAGNKTKNKTPRNQKLKQFEEPFSIRRKIEQFKRWHEEQYLLKLQKLKQESEIKIELSKRSTDGSPKLKLSEKEAVSPPAAMLPLATGRHDNGTLISGDEVDSGNGSAFNMSSVIKSTNSRHKSAKTWKTWRDVNDSYAYTDVEKYIDDNELMTPEKADTIRAWAEEVDKTFFQRRMVNGRRDGKDEKKD